VITPDFELSAGLRARELVTHVPPEAQTETTGDDVTLAHRETRAHLPVKAEPGGRYENVVVEKQVVGQMAAGGESDEELQSASPEPAAARDIT
jgi:hypothetical protein